MEGGYILSYNVESNDLNGIIRKLFFLAVDDDSEKVMLQLKVNHCLATGGGGSDLPMYTMAYLSASI